MRTCPRCQDLCPAASIHCGACGAALLPFTEMVRELARRAAPKPPTPLRNPWRTCGYCGHLCRGATCTYHADLPALEPA